ncbi:uncharacterized protein [Apostichopus japonicus]|uniref:uncharacterized protein isoform X3 n=1 Tax=Stichopus japonicus TaxID=307972 RepID=UPI003AB6F76A
MFIRQNKMLLLWILLVVSSFKGSSSNTVVTYTTKNVEEMQCLINGNTLAATWTDSTTDDSLYVYKISSPDIDNERTEPKHDNFKYSYVPNTHFNLIIDKVEREDEGTYSCFELGDDNNETVYDVTVEAIPDEISFDCFVSPDVTCPAQGVNPTSELICTCAAKGVHPGTLSLDISGADNVQQDSPVANDGLFDLSLTATVPVTDSAIEVTCSVNGYSTTEPIPPNLITKTLMISPPTCALDISFDQGCKAATLNCSCSAIPTDGESTSDPGMVFSYFNGTGHIIAGNATNPYQINDIEAGVNLTYSCRGCNGLNYGASSYDTESKVCTISTTALPTTTIVTTAPPSTNEPTSTKATDATTNTMHTEDSTTESTTEKSESTTTNEPVPPPSPWVIILSSAAALVVCGCGVLIIICLYKKGKCGSNSSSSSVTDVKVTATNSHTTNSEPAPAPVYGEIKKDRKKKSANSGKGIENDGMDPPTDYAEVKMKSEKLDDNGAGPGKDPEIPAYGVIHKNRTKDPTPAPRSSMRDSKNPSKPKQDGPIEMEYADLDHGNKPPSDEVRKPKEEPTEYATVQSVIV